MGWVIARIITGVLTVHGSDPLSVHGNNPLSELSYYYSSHYAAGGGFREYPHPGTWPVSLVALFTGHNKVAFCIGFSLLCLLVDALFLAALLSRHRTSPGAPFAAAWLWIVFGAAAGPILIARLDLFPGLLVALATMLLFTRPYAGSALLGIATGFKLWPGLLGTGLVGKFKERSNWTRVASFFGAILGLCFITIVTRGWNRVTSPFSYQVTRGLQVESIAGGLFTLMADARVPGYAIHYSMDSHSVEVTGPLVGVGIVATDILMLAALLFAVGYAIARLRRGGWTPTITAVYVVVLIELLIVSNKVFSPQYLIWLAMPLAVAVKMVPTTDEKSQSRIAWIAGLLIVTTMLTTFIYPFNYDRMVVQVGQTVGVAIALIVRNLLVIVLTVFTFEWFLQVKRATAPSSGSALPE